MNLHGDQHLVFWLNSQRFRNVIGMFTIQYISWKQLDNEMALVEWDFDEELPLILSSSEGEKVLYTIFWYHY